MINRTAPTAVIGMASGVAAFATAGGQTCALTQIGGAWCWGSNYYGQLGDGTTTQHTSPVQASGLGTGVVMLTAGANHTCALYYFSNGTTG